jgi:hypothetical protein
MTVSDKLRPFGERASAGRWAPGTHSAGEAAVGRSLAAPSAALRADTEAARRAIAAVALPLDFTAAMRRVEAEVYDAA